MTWPASRLTTYAGPSGPTPGSQVKSVDLNAIQDQIILLTAWWNQVISPAGLGGGNHDNWAPTGIATANVVRVTSAGNINGLVAPAVAGKILVLANVGGTSFALDDENISNTAANRFKCPGAVSVTVPVGGAVVVWYDGTSSRWRVIATAI